MYVNEPPDADLRNALLYVPNLGAKAAECIVALRPFKDVQSMVARVNSQLDFKLRISSKRLYSLHACYALHF